MLSYILIEGIHVKAGHTILDATSCHPGHAIKVIPTGEYIRIKQACYNMNIGHGQ